MSTTVSTPANLSAKLVEDVKAVAALLECSTRHVYRMSDAGKMPAPLKLDRTTFVTSRRSEFCSEKELTAQIGHEKEAWPLVVVKELMGNSLDACEEAGVAPEITITVDTDGISVENNGPGIRAETINGVLDLDVRVSNREAYEAPDRGAQGNALMTIVAMSFVLDVSQGRANITANGQRHEISFAVDPIRQEPVIESKALPADNVRKGTKTNLFWPDSACSILTDTESRFLQFADDYTFLNPHLTLTVDWFGQRTQVVATNPGWKKWVPSDPTSPHWRMAKGCATRPSRTFWPP